MLNEAIVEDELESIYNIPVSSDSSIALSIVQNARTSERNKHIALKFHHAKDLVTNVIVRLEYMQIKMQSAGVCTKSLRQKSLEILSLLFGVHRQF